jgi:dolichol-phosphate mannosyltransferase
MDEATAILDRIWKFSLVKRILEHRFIKFGTVGFSGTIINLAMLYLNQEFLFRKIEPAGTRLHVSLLVAIFFATLSNYLWNRWWTWKDRSGKTRHGFWVQMAQYFAASAVAILIQYALTILFSHLIHYLIANVLAIIVAAVFTYVMNDIWTFGVTKR